MTIPVPEPPPPGPTGSRGLLASRARGTPLVEEGLSGSFRFTMHLLENVFVDLAVTRVSLTELASVLGPASRPSMRSQDLSLDEGSEHWPESGETGVVRSVWGASGGGACVVCGVGGGAGV